MAVLTPLDLRSLMTSLAHPEIRIPCRGTISKYQKKTEVQQLGHLFRLSSSRKTVCYIKMDKILPHFAEGEVIKGFGRGSKDLGIPTANFPEKVVENLPKDMPCGVYYGWANVDNGEILKMVLSIGWNPYYNNTKKSMETHIIRTFKEDFYGSTLKVIMLGYIRPMRNFSSLDELISAINADIEEAKEKLDLPENTSYKTNNFLFDEIKKDV